jgi:hypothetical protein
VEATVQGLMATVQEGTFQPCVVSKEIQYLKLGRASGLDDITNYCLRHLPRRPLVHLTHLFNHWFQISHFPTPWKEAKIITLPKPGKDPKFPQNLIPINLLSTTCKLFEADFKNNPKTHLRKKLTECKSVWLSTISQHDTSIYGAGGSHYPKL